MAKAKSAPVAAEPARAKPVLLSGGNPQRGVPVWAER